MAIIHDCQPLITTVTTSSILNVAAALNSSLHADVLYDSLQVLRTLNTL